MEVALQSHWLVGRWNCSTSTNIRVGRWNCFKESTDEKNHGAKSLYLNRI